MTTLSVEDRDYVLKRLDQEHVRQVAAMVRAWIEAGKSCEACYQPGDGTWYSLVFAPLNVLVGAPGGGTNGQPPKRYNGHGVLVCYQQEAEVTAGGTFVLPGTVQGLEELEHIVNKYVETTPASALAIAALLEQVFA